MIAGGGHDLIGGQQRGRVKRRPRISARTNGVVEMMVPRSLQSGAVVQNLVFMVGRSDALKP